MTHFDENAFLTDVSNIWWEGALSETDDVNVLVKKMEYPIFINN